MAGKIAYQKKMEALQKGKLPREYKEIVHKEKKYTSKKAFLENEDLAKEYENRCFVSQDKRRADELARNGMIDEAADIAEALNVNV